MEYNNDEKSENKEMMRHLVKSYHTEMSNKSNNFKLSASYFYSFEYLQHFYHIIVHIYNIINTLHEFKTKEGNKFREKTYSV